ncbi:phosphate ABC transporter substrate-binding protein [Photobacterium sp. CAU 1568]|uniref:Phosphate ABC transporter substrate-binding protein n=1 Tax=Photobacterium arenosum TaxID=2774143 RepID=A0ABR9BFV0_9GAMM|nr:substrate-binding domain-containing protein [Photobacterium arenosum]MBD8511088.1 phosphate ABC transporter substrate-binding protein [Photobacterium arenosum]
MRLMTHTLIAAGIMLATGSVQAAVAVEKELNEMVKELANAQNTPVQLIEKGDIQAAMIADEARLGISSRKWLDSEIALFENTFGYRPVQIFFTYDAVSILVNKDNPVRAMSMGQLKQIFGCQDTPQKLDWRQLPDHQNDDFSEAVPYAVSGELDTHLNFSKLVDCGSEQYLATQFLRSHDEMNDKIRSDINAIGYSVLPELPDELKRIAILDDRGKAFTIDPETVLSGRYPLANVYFLSLNIPPKQQGLTSEQQVLVDLTLDQENQSIIEKHGFLPLPAEAVHRNQVKLKQVLPMVVGGYK